MNDLPQQTRGAGFRLLLETGRAVSAEQIAAELNAATLAVSAELGRLDAAGRIRLNLVRQVVGSAGLSVVPAAHQLWLGALRFWTWCAYDAVGIVGALEADARSLSRSPATGVGIQLEFAAGRAQTGLVALFFPADRGSVTTIDDWCSNANFFENRDLAVSWSAQRKLDGEVIDLDEARRRGLPHWGRLLSANHEIESREDHGDND